MRGPKELIPEPDGSRYGMISRGEWMECPRTGSVIARNGVKSAEQILTSEGELG